MTDMLRSTREEESRRREEVQIHQLQQQVDELRRVIRDNLAHQQWLEEMLKANEGRMGQMQLAQDRYVQDITQSMQARQMEDARLKQQVAELVGRVDEPMKPLRDIRAQLAELADSRKTDREKTTVELRPIQETQSQMRELVAQIGMIADAQRQLRDLVHDLDGVNNETRQEIQRVAESQRLEEQRLRRQGTELQEIVEDLRQQFGDVVSRTHRIDDVRKHFLEHIEGLTGSIGELQQENARFNSVMQRLEKQVLENNIAVQERVETQRSQHDTEIVEFRAALEQRLDRFYGRFQGIEDHLRELELRLGEIPPHLDILHRRDDELVEMVEGTEDTHLRHELANIEAQIEEVRQRRAKQAAANATKKGGGLVKNVREARISVRPTQSDEEQPAPQPE